MPEPGLNFDDAAKARVARETKDALRAGEKRKLGRAANKSSRILARRLGDERVGQGINAEGLFTEQVLAGLNDIGLELRS
jgi:hypothetical protein